MTPCIFDRASDLEQRQREEALERHRQQAQAAVKPGAAATECADCGGDIPAARRAAVPGCTRCVPCAQLAEAAARRFNR